MFSNRSIRVAACVSLILAGGSAAQAASSEAQSLNELRNTVVNLLQGLVDRGVLTREQAEQMVRDAQTKAQADAATTAATEAAEANAVRVPYVPEVVREELRKQVAAELGEQVTRDVKEAALNEGWGSPAALPDWARRMRWYGDMRVRGQDDIFASDNIANAYRDFQRINEAGGFTRAGQSAYMNVTEDRDRLRLRLRLGFETVLGYGWTMGARVATGSLRDPISTNQTLGSSNFRHQLGLDLAYIDYAHSSRTGRHTVGFSGGRLRNPFYTATDLVYDQDLTFDGLASTYRLGLNRDDPTGRNVYVTAGAFPLQEVELSSRDKWLMGGQLGLDWKLEDSSRIRLAASYYNFRRIAGQRNLFDSNLLDFTAPQYLRQGNTVFDIRNDNDGTTNLYALAADYKLVNASLLFDKRLGTGYRATLAADYVRNIGYDVDAILARTGTAVPERSIGYQAEVGFGTVQMNRARAWRAAVGYRYLQRDAVLDSFTDSDFRLGGTDTKGYYITLDYGFTPMVMGRIKYLSANELDGPPLGIDVLQIDLTASF
jgi:polyhydroxyalkanoate synthesis regulator phasin